MKDCFGLFSENVENSQRFIKCQLSIKLFVICRYEPKSENNQIDERIEFEVVHEQQEKASNRLVISSLLGSISTFVWEGFLFKEGKPEKAKQV